MQLPQLLCTLLAHQLYDTRFVIHVESRKLYLVDLAGSENIKRSGAEGKHQKEAGLINKSLCHLKTVIEEVFRGDKVSTYRYLASQGCQASSAVIHTRQSCVLQAYQQQQAECV